ncbi:MAG: hypothetical protein IJR14_04425 [Synergistaceae bacterium]|nr:hypothetical protein [Synergistaceae bacterium]
MRSFTDAISNVALYTLTIKRGREADQISALETEIKAEMDAQGATEMAVGPFKLSWTPYKSTRLDSKALKSEMPDIWGRYSVTTETRRFAIA